MMIFVDTGAWYALVDSSDKNHKKSVGFINDLKQPLITSNFVVDETLTLVKNKLGYDVAKGIGENLWKGKAAKIIRVSEEDEMYAWDIFLKYKDKNFSFTDCTSFAVMDRFSIKSAFTFDEHFKQYGKKSMPGK